MTTTGMPAPRRRLRAAAAGAVLLAGLLMPASGNEVREHGAHVHGHGTLDVVAEGEELVIELRVPAMHVVGFEHEPATEEQRHTVERAVADFRQATKLFATPAAARCEPEHVEVTLSGMTHQADHDGHEHQEGGKHEGHDVEPEGAAHSELHGEYRYHCREPGKLQRLDVRVFGHLTGAGKLHARVVTSTVQTAVTLAPDDTVLELDR